MRILILGPPCPKIENAILKHGHDYVRTENPICFEWLNIQQFDFGISYRYRHLIHKQEVDFFRGKLINLHISYLPWNRGSDPNLWSFLEDTPRGVTIHQIDYGLDTGDILLQKEVNIDVATATLATSYEQLLHAVEELFIENIDFIFSTNIVMHKQRCGGSYHKGSDRIKYSHLIDTLSWDTPVRCILGKNK